MDNQTRLTNYTKELCQVLNESGYQRERTYQGETHQINYQVDEESPWVTIMLITENKPGYKYLKENGHIDSSICHFCGEHPIDNTYGFTEPVNHIRLNICRRCNKGGRQEQKTFQRISGQRSGCLVIIPILIAIVLFILL